MKGNNPDINIATKVIHIGSEPDPTTGAIIPPIFQTSTYVQTSPGIHQGFEYTRSHNPTRSRLESCLASLENAKHALVTSSGMAATTLIMHALGTKKKILCGDDVYGGTYRLFTTVFNDTHEFKFIDTTNLEEVQSSIEQFNPNMIWIESPTNPILKISNIEEIATMAKSSNAKVVVDNTFMSPYFQNPIDLGADIVVHSMTKFLNGHSDIVGGCLMLNDQQFYEKIWYLQNSIGPSQSPFDSWLTLRGIKTLSVRMEAHQKNAKTIATYLESHEKVEKVLYPGLESHPQYELAKKQMKGPGGMITFFIKGGLNESKVFLESLKIFSLAESLGGVESLVDHPAIMTHASIPKDVREKIGIFDNLVRLSVGIENIDDLKKDLEFSLSQF